ncbi:MAG: hypothetical protein V7750_15115 [Sneathiella sp.]
MKIVIAFLLVFLFPLVVNASVMTFDSVPAAGIPLPYSENGIFTPAALSFNNLEAVHIDDFGTGHPDKVEFTMSSRFDALSFDLYGYPTRVIDPFNNVYVQGWRGGSLVASDEFWMGDFNTYLFGDLFSNLDKLIIGVQLPVPFSKCFFEAPCTHFNIDNVTLTAVPLPASFPIFFAGLALLGWVRFRRAVTNSSKQ